MEGITVKDISRHMSQNLYVMTVLQVSRAVVLPPLSNLLVHADCVPEKLVPGNGLPAHLSLQHRRSNMSDGLESAQQ